jgi:hypothetical protein
MRERKTNMIDKSELTIDRNSEGAWRVSAIVDGYLVTRRYYDYSRRQAVELFLEEVN